MAASSLSFTVSSYLLLFPDNNNALFFRLNLVLVFYFWAMFLVIIPLSFVADIYKINNSENLTADLGFGIIQIHSFLYFTNTSFNLVSFPFLQFIILARINLRIFIVKFITTGPAANLMFLIVQ